MKRNQGRRRGPSSSKGPRLPGTLLKELGTSSGGGGKGKRVTAVKRRREDGGMAKKRVVGRGSKFDELVPVAAAVARGSVEKREGKRKAVNVGDVDDPEAILQKKLAKKLGLKSTRLNDGQDGLDDLLQEFDDVMTGEYSDPSNSAADDSDSESDSEPDTSLLRGEESSDDASEDVDVPVKETKYVPPALRKRAREEEATMADEQEMAVQKRVRGLINRVAEANLEGIVSYVSCIILPSNMHMDPHIALYCIAES